MTNPPTPEKPEILCLITQAKNGNEDATAELFARYAGLIHTQCAPYLSSAPSEQELQSEAMMAFWNAVNRYDTARRVTFGLYAQICIKNRLISCSRSWRKMGKTLSLDDESVAELQACDNSNPATYLVEQEQYHRLINLIDQVLSEGERQVWLRFAAGRTAAEIAQELGKDKKAVENAIFRSRRKIRKAIPPQFN